MTTQIEAAIGTTVRFPEESSLGQANKVLAQREAGGARDTLGILVEEFDTTVTIINSLSSNPDQVDSEIFKHLRKTAEILASYGLTLPTLSQIRESQNPQVRKGVDKVMGDVKKGLKNPKKAWGFLGEMKTPRLMIGSLFVDSYKHLVVTFPEFQKHPEIFKELNCALEEASVWFHPEFSINRAATKWYTEDEGFTPEFIDFAKTSRLIEACRILRPEMLSRKNLDKVWSFIKEHPRDVLDLARTLNQSVADLNGMQLGFKEYHLLKNIYDLKMVVGDTPLPLFLGQEEPKFNMTNLHGLYRALKTTNSHMKTGESVASAAELPEDTRTNLEYARFHVEVNDPKAILAGLMTHLVEYWAKEIPAFKILGRDTMINALCEIIGYKHSDSELFKLLYNKDGLNWYAEGWGFEKKFTDYLDKIVKAKVKTEAMPEA